MMIDEIMIRGTETSNRNSVNFIPRNDASKIIIGILQTAAAPTYVKTTLNFAPFLNKTAAMGKDLGRFSFRGWRLSVSFASKGSAILQVRATNQRGEKQPAQATWNPGGYQRQVIESTPVVIA